MVVSVGMVTAACIARVMKFSSKIKAKIGVSSSS